MTTPTCETCGYVARSFHEREQIRLSGQCSGCVLDDHYVKQSTCWRWLGERLLRRIFP